MDYKINILVISCLVYLRINSVSGLQCHVCSTHSEGQEDCERIAEGQTKYLADCESAQDVSCRTQEQWVEFEVLGQKHVKRTIRQCATTLYDPARPCYYRTGFGGKVSVCNCLGDGCNGAKALNAANTLLATLGLLLVSKFLFKYT